MMATTSSTTKNKPDNQSLTKSRPLGPKPKPKPVLPSSNAEESGRKTVEKKPLPNYLKPTVSSRPDPVKFLRKNKAVEEDNQKLIRRRSFDRPLSSSSSTHKPLNTSSPARPRDRPAVPRENHAVTGLRSTSFHGSSRGGLRGSTTVKSPALASSRGPPGVKKSGTASSSKSKKEGGSENVPKKILGKEITPECSPPAHAHEDVEEIVKVVSNVQVPDHIEEEYKAQVAQRDESEEGKETIPVDASTEEEKGELINEEQKERENTQEEEEEVVEKRVDVEENSETVVTPDTREGETESEVKVEESESSKVKETNGHVEERTKKEVVKGKKGSPTAYYNDVIASKMQESSRKKNKVLALAGAFQTVIDYETAASK